MIIGKKTSGMIRQLFDEMDPRACQASGGELCPPDCYLHGLRVLTIVEGALEAHIVEKTLQQAQSTNLLYLNSVYSLFTVHRALGSQVERVYRSLSEYLSEDAVQRVWGAIAEEELVISEADRIVLLELFGEARGTICHKADWEVCDCHQRSFDAVQAIAGILGCTEMTSQEIAESIRKALLPHSLQAFVAEHLEVDIEPLDKLAYVWREGTP